MKQLIGNAILTLVLLASSVIAQAQGTTHPKNYEWPASPAVQENLEQWQDLKFGVIFHWGLYSIPGILESWVLCGEDLNWINRFRPENMSYEEFKTWYWGLKDQFDPTQFDPEQWAGLMKKGGMKYVVFTTKHHEGFCLWDTKETDFSVMNSPFGQDARANVTKEVFDAFRKQNFKIGAYFSKPDWHSEYYWWPYFPTKDRNVNYSIKRHPDRWQKFCQFTYNQIEELVNGDYGKIDILWLDGGQVAPKWYDQDIHMDQIAEMARGYQPGLIMVDRTVEGTYENYLTPEGVIPEKQLDVPWETCYSMNGWGWRKEGTYKSSKRIISTFIEVVAKGGNFLLGVGPTAQGTIDPEATDRVETIGRWLEKNGEGIYSTVRAEHYNDGPVWFTADKDGQTLYAFYALPEKVEEVPEVIEWTTNLPSDGKVYLLSNGKRVKCQIQENRVILHLPKNLDRTESIGFVFRVK